MGCTSSKAAPGAEAVVSAAVAPKFAQAAKAHSDAGSDVKSSKPASLADPTSPPGSGAPVMLFDTRGFGCEEAREGAVQALGVVDTPVDDPRFNAITKLMASIFQTPVALITLITEDRVWFKSKVGPFGACVTREGSWCNYISVPNTPEVLITEDASEDARFAANPYVAGAPFIKFYAGAPLVGKGGMRYGTLCVVDLKRRAFSAEMYALLVNFANLVVQELERDDAAMGEAAADAAALAAGQAAVQRAVAGAASSVSLVDVRSRAWPLLYANDGFARDEGGGDVDSLTAASFWELFEPADPGGMKAADAAVAAGHATRVAVLSKRTGARLSIVLRPASSDQLQPGKAIGIPNWVPSERDVAAGCHAGALPGALEAGGAEYEGPAGTESVPAPELASCFWFAAVEGSPASSAATSLATPGTPAAGGAPVERPPRRASVDSPRTFGSQALPAALDGLETGPIIGSGSFGRVYRGRWRGGMVAVKLVDCAFGGGGGSRGSALDVAVHEAELSKQLDHPCLVRTHDYAVVEAPGGGGGTLWMVQQLCNHGTLMEAVDRGWLRRRRSLAAPPCMEALLATLREVAAGMACLHARDVLHCDLTGNNVLLEAAPGDPRGFRARVGDFGLARVAAGAVTTATFGTCSHMAPELMAEGALTKAADVWSFGVIAWELYCGTRAYVGHRMPHIVFLVTSGRGALALPPGAPAPYAALVADCLSRDPGARPSFEQLVARIDDLASRGLVAAVAPPPPLYGMGPCKAAAELAAAATAVAAPARA